MLIFPWKPPSYTFANNAKFLITINTRKDVDWIHTSSLDPCLTHIGRTFGDIDALILWILNILNKPMKTDLITDINPSWSPRQWRDRANDMSRHYSCNNIDRHQCTKDTQITPGRGDQDSGVIISMIKAFCSVIVLVITGHGYCND